MKYREFRPRVRRATMSLATVLMVSFTPWSTAIPADDTALFQTAVTPNVLIVMDNSGSMANIVWHPSFTGAAATQTTCTTLQDANVARGYPRNQALFWLPPHNTLWPSNVAEDIGLNAGTGFFRSGKTYCGVATSTSWGIPKGDFGTPNAWDWSSAVDPAYMDYLFTSAGATARAALFTPTTANGGVKEYDSCLGLAPGTTYQAMRQTRMQALRNIIKTVVCRVKAQNTVRFGLAHFRYRETGSDGNVNGGFVVLPIDDFESSPGTDNVYTMHGQTQSHLEHLNDVVDSLYPFTFTPLSETLFNVYTYFMDRSQADRPFGRDSAGTANTTRFPAYSYDTNKPSYSSSKVLDHVGGSFLTMSGGDASASAPPCPVEDWCQRNFVLFITDGTPTQDNFTLVESPTNTGQGYSNFPSLIGDHHVDGETECCFNEDGSANANGMVSYWLDDIAKFMHSWDMLPNETDFPGDQVVDVYTVGFALGSNFAATSLLSRAATLGGGKYFESNDTTQLGDDIVDAINDMMKKSQAFTSATVPATRTRDGDSFYSSYFLPQRTSPFWDGHLKSFKFTTAGDILTNADKCAVGADATATPPCDNSGVLRPDATPVWDAATSMPAPGSRNLFFGDVATTFSAQAEDWDGVTKTDLGLVAGDLSVPPLDDAADLDALAVMIENNLKGCAWNTSCTARTLPDGTVNLLGDIFHSNPLVVGSPNAAINIESYRLYKNANRTRPRVIYAGSNDGWLHGFNAGTWDSAATPPAHTRGSGAELFGYMPKSVMRRIKELPSSGGIPRTFYGVDGSPVAADVWSYRAVGTGTDLGSVDANLVHPPASDSSGSAVDKMRWRTVVMAGLRQGGNTYSALDVTFPGGSNYPGFMWEFPCGTSSSDCTGAVNATTYLDAPYMGETWSDPVITRVKVRYGSATTLRERWVAIFGAGYSEEGDPNHADYDNDHTAGDFSPAGRAIMMVDITTGQLLAIKRFNATAASITTSNGSTSETGQVGFPEMKFAFPSAPAVFDLNFDGFADVIYIGDLGGNLWKWVITKPGDDPINGSGAVLDNLGQPNWPFGIFMRAPTSSVAYDAGGAWSAGIHFNSFFNPPTGVLRNYQLVLAAGTGERAAASFWDTNTATTNNNRFYVLRDPHPYERASETAAVGDLVVGTTGPALKEASLTDITTTIPACGTLASASGYFVVGRDSEKFLTRSVVFKGQLLTGAYLPEDPGSADACSKSGDSYLYNFDIDCGNGAYTPGGGWSGNTTTESQRRRQTGAGVPNLPRISMGDINLGGGGNNRAIVVTSDGSVLSEDMGDLDDGSGITVRSWRER